MTTLQSISPTLKEQLSGLSVDAKANTLCKMLSVLIALDYKQEVEITFIGNGEITFHTYDKTGVKAIQRVLKPWLKNKKLILKQIRTYAACDVDPESYLVIVEPPSA